jgi:isoleucyl-tRNA synthetase
MAYRTVLDTLFHALVRYAAPVLVFTAEEVWGMRFPEGGSVHLLEWPTLLTGEDHELQHKWDQIRGTRMLANEIIEPMRREKVIGSSLEVEYSYQGDFGDVDLAEVLIVSAVHKGPTGAVKTTHHKCGRCWRHLPDVAEDGDLCSRCDQVVAGMDAA